MDAIFKFIIKPNVNSMITSYVGYTRLLTEYIIDYTEDNELVKKQKEEAGEKVEVAVAAETPAEESAEEAKAE